MREHEGIINIECRLVKSMDEEGNIRVARPVQPQTPPLLLSHKRYLGEHLLTDLLVQHIMNGN
jgi:hypothetical protein